MTRVTCVAVAILLAACSGRGVRGPHGPTGSPDRPQSVGGARDPAVLASERALRDLDGAAAEAVLERAGGVDPAAMERSWLLLDLWRTRCAERRASEAVDRVARGDDFSRVLLAHVAGSPAERVRLVRPAFSGPASGWAHLEAALSFEEEGEREGAARSHATRAAAAGPALVRREALLLLGRLALEDGALEEALRLGERGVALDPEDPRFESLRSIAAARTGNVDDALRFSARALQKHPKSGRAARRVADMLRERPSAAVEQEVASSLAPLLASAKSGEAVAVSGQLAESRGDRAEAIERYAEALRLGASPVPVDRRLRRLLFAAGRRAEGLALLVRAVPPEARTDRRNLLHGAWAALDEAGRGASGADASDAALETLAEALVPVGGLEEARAVLSTARKRTPRADALAARLGAELAFERALRDEVEQGYRKKAEDASPGDLGSLLSRVAVLARRHLPAEEAAAFGQPTAGVRIVPFLGGWLDTSCQPDSPVVAHFRRYGRFLVAGQRTGEPPEAILLSLASLVPRQEIRTQGRRFVHDVAIGYDREARSYLDFRGGALSGACLPDGVWLDADSSRREEHGFRAAAQVDAVLAERLARASSDPPPADGIDGPFSLDRPGCLSLRLIRRYLARGGDGWGAFRALSAHEFGHVLDIDRHLPLVSGLPESLSVLFGQGCSLDKVEAFLEGRAQRASVIDAPDPDLALADLVRSLPLRERSPGAHDRGYRDQAEEFVRHVYAYRRRYPSIDPTREILPQLDRLTNDEIRAVARAVAGL